MVAQDPCSGRPWQTATRASRLMWQATNQPCALCRQPIDYTLPARHRWGLTVDHIVPRWAGGSPLDPRNWQPAHRSCNSSRGTRELNARRSRSPQPDAPRRTDLTW